MITNRMIVSILGAFAFVVLATLLGHFLIVAHTQSGIAQTQAEEESFFAALRRETNATFFVPEHDVFGATNGYAASGTPCTLPYLGNCGDLLRVAVKPVPGQPVPFALPSYTNAPHEFDSEQSQINGRVIWTAYYFDAKNQRIVEYHYANRSTTDVVTGLSAPVTTWPHIAWMGAGMLLASTGAVGYASPSPVYTDLVQQDAALAAYSGTTPLPIYGTPSCANPPGQVELYMQAFLSRGFQAQYPGTAALAHPACFPFDVITKMGGPPDDLAGNLNLFLEVQGVPADDSAPLPYTAGPIKSDHYFVPLHRAVLIGGMHPPMPRVVNVYYGVHSSVMPTSATAMQVWAQSQTDTSGTWSYTAAQPTPNPAQVAAISAMPGDTSLGDLSIGEAWAQGYHWLVSLPSCSVLSGGSWSANVAPAQAYRSNQVGPSSLFAADGSGIGYSVGYVALPQPPSPPASTVTCNGTVQLIMPAGGWPGGAVAPTAKFSLVYAAGATAMLTWPAGGIVEATSGSTLAMLPMHEPLIAKLFGAEMADALTTGCKAVVIASGTFPTSYVPASLSQLPTAAQTLFSGQGYTVDGSGCVWQNGAPATQAPIVAYEPGGTSATYNPLAQNCTYIASLGLPKPGNTGAQVAFPVIPGSTPGSCTVTITASPAPSGTPGPGSGLVPVQVAQYPCQFIGGSCTLPAGGLGQNTTACDPTTHIGSGSITSYRYYWYGTPPQSPSAPGPVPATVGTVSGLNPSTFTRTGPGTVYGIMVIMTRNMAGWPCRFTNGANSWSLYVTVP